MLFNDKNALPKTLNLGTYVQNRQHLMKIDQKIVS